MNHKNLIINLSMLSPKPTGISTYAANLFPYLKPLNPILLTAQDYPKYQCYSIPGNLTPIQGKKGHLYRLLWTQFKLPKLYHQLQASLLFSPIPEAPLYTNCRYVVMVHDLIPLRFPNWSSPLSYYFRYYIPLVLNQAEHIICNSQATAKDITDFYGVASQKITPILLAHDNNHFRKLPTSTNNPDCPYFIYLGRHDPYKNLHRLIDAFAAIPNCHNYQLWLAGPPDLRYTPQLQIQAQELEISAQVKFLDYVPYNQLPLLLNQALALVFPTLWEGFGFPVLEAMACGTPVITSNLSSVPEVAGNAGILINPYCTEEITAAMQAIAENGQLRAHLSNLSLQQASQFNWAKTGQATLEVIQEYL